MSVVTATAKSAWGLRFSRPPFFRRLWKVEVKENPANTETPDVSVPQPPGYDFFDSDTKQADEIVEGLFRERELIALTA